MIYKAGELWDKLNNLQLVGINEECELDFLGDMPSWKSIQEESDVANEAWR